MQRIFNFFLKSFNFVGVYHSSYLLAMTTPGDSSGLSSGDLSQVLDCLRSEIQSLKREREAADERLVKRMKIEKRPTFKKKAHEKQFVFNDFIIDKFEDIVTAAQQTPPAIEKVKTAVIEGIKSLNVDKHIRIMIDENMVGQQWRSMLRMSWLMGVREKVQSC